MNDVYREDDFFSNEELGRPYEKKRIQKIYIHPQTNEVFPAEQDTLSTFEVGNEGAEYIERNVIRMLPDCGCDSENQSNCSCVPPKRFCKELHLWNCQKDACRRGISRCCTKEIESDGETLLVCPMCEAEHKKQVWRNIIKSIVRAITFQWLFYKPEKSNGIPKRDPESRPQQRGRNF